MEKHQSVAAYLNGHNPVGNYEERNGIHYVPAEVRFQGGHDYFGQYGRSRQNGWARVGPMMRDLSASGDLVVAVSAAARAGTCRTFDMALNDGGPPQAIFRLVR